MEATVFDLNKTITLESGAQLVDPHIAYHTYGSLNDDKSNVVWICHALTANSDVFEWWPGLVGYNEIINPNDHYIVCANMLGSHYGTTSPLSINPDSGHPYYHSFPDFTIRDIVLFNKELAKHLGIEEIHILIGGSMGGHQALEWAIMEPKLVKNLVVIASSAVHSPWGVAFNESQRLAIENDPSWSWNEHNAGIEGMKTARSIALLSYRNFKAYHETQQPSNGDLIYPDKAPSYQKYQGEKLAARFNAFSYWYLSRAMDSQNVGRNRKGVEAALSKIKARTMVLTLEGDMLFPQIDQTRIVEGIPNAEHYFIPSNFGHDGFLIETDKISSVIQKLC